MGFAYLLLLILNFYVRMYSAFEMILLLAILTGIINCIIVSKFVILTKNLNRKAKILKNETNKNIQKEKILLF